MRYFRIARFHPLQSAFFHQLAGGGDQLSVFFYVFENASGRRLGGYLAFSSQNYVSYLLSDLFGFAFLQVQNDFQNNFSVGQMFEFAFSIFKTTLIVGILFVFPFPALFRQHNYLSRRFGNGTAISSGVAVNRSADGAGNSRRPFQAGQTIVGRFVYQLAKKYARSGRYHIFVNFNSPNLDFYNQSVIASIAYQNITPPAQQKKRQFLALGKANRLQNFFFSFGYGKILRRSADGKSRMF